MMMEGYLLALPKDRDAQLWFCVLEHGVLRCFVKPKGALIDTVELTRHDVRVVVHPDGVCPNEFAIHRVAVQFDETRAVLRRQCDKQRVHRFAAPSPELMRKWGRAIQNWKRYAFIEPISGITTSPTESRKEQRAAQREEAHTLISFVTSFDLRLKQAVPKSSTTTSSRTRTSMISLTTEDRGIAKGQRLSVPTGRASQSSSLSSWIPKRVPSWRRMWSTPPQA